MFRRCLSIKSKSPNYEAFRFSSNLSEDDILHQSYGRSGSRSKIALTLPDKDLNAIAEDYITRGVLERGRSKVMTVLPLYQGNRDFSLSSQLLYTSYYIVYTY